MPEKLDYVTTLPPEVLEQAEKELGEDEHLRMKMLSLSANGSRNSRI